MALRYTLAEQVNFLGFTPDQREVVITLQRWQSTTSATQLYVRTHNGAEFIRHLCTSDTERAQLDGNFHRARTEHAGDMLSDDAAGDEIARRGGPKPRWCSATDCGAIVPYAAAQCADGHAAHHTNAGTYSHGNSRRYPLTVITGGRR